MYLIKYKDQTIHFESTFTIFNVKLILEIQKDLEVRILNRTITDVSAWAFGHFQVFGHTQLDLGQVAVLG